MIGRYDVCTQCGDLPVGFSLIHLDVTICGFNDDFNVVLLTRLNRILYIISKLMSLHQI